MEERGEASVVEEEKEERGEACVVEEEMEERGERRGLCGGGEKEERGEACVVEEEMEEKGEACGTKSVIGYSSSDLKKQILPPVKIAGSVNGIGAELKAGLTFESLRLCGLEIALSSHGTRTAEEPDDEDHDLLQFLRKVNGDKVDKISDVSSGP
ncbi:hypothetical protein EYF80_048466 [Liparis tanakae]|uniref:Uncharacterized protein n=1 Tax=Liparis tanakae TaxID=230148 RepID=A0A4Z2FJI9_9TELE|nr:hypothetical protein EYF80_048466 [Liparis tanakae]